MHFLLVNCQLLDVCVKTQKMTKLASEATFRIMFKSLNKKVIVPTGMNDGIFELAPV